MESRRRQPSASTSTSHSNDDVPKPNIALRRTSTSSIPPAEEGDENTPRRATRGRNPLPPTAGPLFPPLPPKPPRNSPKNSPQTSRSTPQARTPLASHSIQPTTEPEKVIIQGAELSTLTSDVNGDSASRHSSPSDSTTKLPSVSGTSLTPPPPTSEDVDLDMDVDPPEIEGDEENNGDDNASGANGGESEDWDSYQQHRRIRGFGDAKNDVKLEPEDDNDEEETPKRNGSRRAEANKGEATSAGSPPSVAVRETSAARARRRRGEEQLLLDDHLLPEEMRKTGSITEKRRKSFVKGEEEVEEKGREDVEEVGDDDDEEDEEQADATRCVCKTEDNDVMMIQCDKCNVWQHGPCVGIWLDEEAPDEYFCEECRPDLHGPLRKWMRSRGRNIANFVPPTPQDLQKFHNSYDRHPPSQSKRWLEDPLYENAKPPARSHHRKTTGSPVDLTDGRRSTRGRLPPAPSEKPVSTGKDKRKEPPPGRRNVSITSPSPSASPPPFHPPKRRSTMNSRDAAYEEQVRAALEASRKDSVPLEHDEEHGEGEEEERKEMEEEVEEVVVDAPARKGKRKREDEETASDAANTPVPSSASLKPKHPNQYTYRPKPPSSNQAVASPARRIGQASTPVPSLPPPAQHEHGTRRAGAIANGIIPPPPNSISVHNLHWHLPDHLSSFSELLPSPQPIALESRAPRQLTSFPRNHFHNQKYGPFSEDRDENGKLVLPDEPTSRDPIGDPITQLEPPARVRYPVKRITTTEMRKRVRNVLEYVGRVQGEETKRKERAKLIGIDPGQMPPVRRFEEDGGETMEDEEKAPRRPSLMIKQGPTSESLMDDLMKDLIAFQETFNAAAGFISPMPPAIATFTPNPMLQSAPPTPIPHVTSTLAQEILDEPAEAEAEEVGAEATYAEQRELLEQLEGKVIPNLDPVEDTITFPAEEPEKIQPLITEPVNLDTTKVELNPPPLEEGAAQSAVSGAEGNDVEMSEEIRVDQVEQPKEQGIFV